MSSEAECDGLLVERVRSRDPEALAQFVENNRRQLLAYLDRHVGAVLKSRIEIEDLLQEVVTEAIRSLPNIDLTDRDPFGWLCQLAERRIIDAHRRLVAAKKRDVGRERSIDRPSLDGSRAGLVNLLVASMTSASRAFSRQEREIRMLSALEQLPEDQREALRLRYLEGWPSKQIAAHLGKTDGAVRVMLTRSLGKLQSLLVDSEDA